MHSIISRANRSKVINFIAMAACKCANELRVAYNGHLFTLGHWISTQELFDLFFKCLSAHPNFIFILIRIGKLKQYWHCCFDELIVSALRPELIQDHSLLLRVP